MWKNSIYLNDPLVDRDCVILDGHCNCLKGFCRKYDSEERVREEAGETDTPSKVKS